MKKRWFLVPILAGVLALGITGGVALANDAGTGDASPWSTFASKVAAILGLEEAQVQDAFNQASRETQDEALQQKLDRMVEEGRMTQPQADEYKEWHLSRPEGLSPRDPFGGFRGHGFHRGRMRGFGGMWFNCPESVTPIPESSGATTS